MDKNYYDILQININASHEIIEKAYKTLAKKYHPDLQPLDNKKEAENILKEINEAYEVLSDSIKKHEYDTKLKQQKEIEEKVYQQYKSSTLQEQTIKKRKLQYEEEQLKQEQLKQQELQKQLEYEKQMEYARQKAYHDAYIQDLKNRGYKIRYKKTFKDYLRGAISIIAVIFAFFLLWQIPFIRNYFIDFYKENEIIRFLVDSIMNLFKKS